MADATLANGTSTVLAQGSLANSFHKLNSDLDSLFLALERQKTRVNMPHINPLFALCQQFDNVVTLDKSVYVTGWPEFSFEHKNARGGVNEQPTLIKGGVTYNLRKLGNVGNYLTVPNFVESKSAVDALVERTQYYYLHDDLPTTDILRYINPTFRKQHLEEMLSRPYIFTRDSISAHSSLGAQTVAIVKSNGRHIAFSQNSVCEKQFTDAMRTNFPSFAPEDICEKNKKIYVKQSTEGSKQVLDFFTHVQAHKIETDEHTYAFPATWLKTRCYCNDRSITLDDYPQIAYPPYLHMFVFSDGKVCFNGNARFKEIGMVSGIPYSLADANVSYQLARVLLEGPKNLIHGYGEGCRPAQFHYTLKDLEIKNGDVTQTVPKLPVNHDLFGGSLRI